MIALKQGNQNPQNNTIASFFFALTGKCNSMFKSFTSAGRDFDSTIKFSASTGEGWFACGTEVAFDINQVDFTPSSLFSRDQQTAVGSLLRMEAFLPKTKKKLLLNVLRNKWSPWKRTWSISWHLAPFANRHNRAAKHKNLLSSSSVVTKINRSKEKEKEKEKKRKRIGQEKRNKFIGGSWVGFRIDRFGLKKRTDCGFLRQIKRIRGFLKHCWIVDQLWILARIPDCACLES